MDSNDNEALDCDQEVLKNNYQEIMNSKDEALDQDQEALNNYQETIYSTDNEDLEQKTLNNKKLNRGTMVSNNNGTMEHNQEDLNSHQEEVDVKDIEILARDQKALNNYHNSRKRQRSTSSSSSSDKVAVRTKKEKNNDDTSRNPTESVWQHDPSGLYGLKPEYLRILGIEPPICSWVSVENFRCDKSELREVLELAGYVVVCSLIYAQPKHAKVMYSHPLEAVQAISMLNKQMLYGRALSVTMMRYPLDNVILPKALPTVGPGFGAYGKPLRDIVKHYERFVNMEPNSLNPLLFYDPNDPQDNQKMTAPESVETDKKSRDEIYDRFQFSKQFVIRHIEDDSDDSRSEKDSNNGTDYQLKDAPKTTAVPKYSPGSPTRSPLSDIDRKSEMGSGAGYSLNKFSTATNQSSPAMGPNGGHVGSMGTIPSQHNNPHPTPMGQRSMIAPNAAPGPIGPRFGPNPLAGPGFRPDVPTSGSNVPPIYGQQPMPNHMAGPRFRPNVLINGPNLANLGQQPRLNPVGPGFRPNVPMTNVARPNGPITRQNAPMTNVPKLNAPITMPGIRPNIPMSGPNMAAGPTGSGLRPNTGPTTVQFRNLPPTTTFGVLSEKLSQCGPLLSLQLAARGCATAAFAHAAHAHTCFQRFNNMCVDGCVIQARIV
ncbi:uncharacterized protein LOC128675917 [Plodia interpunctella]|uniref:uncharacterized protein LOC128675917 n=1 Tax=Plodia interpunctella TaxID=58824 RepID=UPI002367F3A6|nr:uncharacterized protein LOC128675917 [Plodia interpunctella]